MTLKRVKWDVVTDFISIGSGIGGVTAAIVTNDLGKKAMILEKASKVGGVSAYSAGQVYLPNNHKMKEAGIADSDEAAMKYYAFLGNGYGDKEMLLVMYESAHDAIKYLEEKAGVKWRIIRDFPDYYYPHVEGTLPEGRYLETELFEGAELGEWQNKSYLSPVMPYFLSHKELFGWGSLGNILKWDFDKMAEHAEKDMRGLGPGMMGFFLKAALVDRNIPVFIDTVAKELITEGGRVTGIRAEREGKDFFVKSRNGVIIAAGGYDHNEEMARYWEDMPKWRSMTPKSVAGDNFILGGDVGAAIAGVPPGNLGCPMGYHIPGEEQEGIPLWRASQESSLPHAIWVNRAGKRFCDESFYRDFQPACRQFNGRKMDQLNYPPYLILDANFRSRYAIGTIMPGENIPAGFGHEAHTIRELAGKLGLPADELEATINRYNELCDKGLDCDFGRGDYPWCIAFSGDKNYPNPVLGHIKTPPFFGIELCPVNTGVNAVGLKINKYAQVMNVRGIPVKGLYATGNSAAQIEIGAGYNSGVSNTRGIAWAYVAAHHANKGE